MFGVDDLAIAMIGSAIVSGAASYMGGQRSNAANAQQAAQQQAFQQQMFSDNQAFSWDMVHSNENFQREMVANQERYNDQTMAQQMDFQRESANTAMQYAERMSNTSMQRRMEDLRAAGLNPMLAIQQGGASSPSIAPQSGAQMALSAPTGSTGHVSSPTGAMARMENVLGPAVSNALRAAESVQGFAAANAEIEKTRATTGLIDEQKNQTRANTVLSTLGAVSEKERSQVLRSESNLNRDRLGLVSAQTGQAVAEAENRRTQTELAPHIAGAGIARDRAAAGASQAQETQTRQQTEADRTYGRGGFRNPVEPISQTLQSIMESLVRTWR